MNVGFLIATVGRCARLALVGAPLRSSAQGESADPVGNPSLQLCLSLVKERKQEGTEILYELFSCQTLLFLSPVCSLRGSDTINPCPPRPTAFPLRWRERRAERRSVGPTRISVGTGLPVRVPPTLYSSRAPFCSEMPDTSLSRKWVFVGYLERWLCFYPQQSNA